MARFEIRFKESVAKDLRYLPNKDVERILKRIDALRSEPRPVGCEKLSAQERYRVRQGVYRIIYEIKTDCHIVPCFRGQAGGLFRNKTAKRCIHSPGRKLNVSAYHITGTHSAPPVMLSVNRYQRIFTDKRLSRVSGKRTEVYIYSVRIPQCNRRTTDFTD